MCDRIESAGVSCEEGEPDLPGPADRLASTLKLDARGRSTAGSPEPGAFQTTAAESRADHDHAPANATNRYSHPCEILRDPKLSAEQKRNLLRQWALDAYCTEVATMDGMSPGASQLDEAIDALIDLDGGTASISKLSAVRLGESRRQGTGSVMRRFSGSHSESAAPTQLR
jgi:hypothetical protein